MEKGEGEEDCLPVAALQLTTLLYLSLVTEMWRERGKMLKREKKKGIIQKYEEHDISQKLYDSGIIQTDIGRI